MSRPGEITKERVTIAVRNALSVFVGRGRRWTTADVADGIGVEQRTVQHWLSGDNAPDLDTLFKLMAFLGPAFTNKVIAIAGMGAACALGEESTTATEALKDMLDASNKLIALGDHASHEEKARALEWLPGLIARLGGLQNSYARDTKA